LITSLVAVLVGERKRHRHALEQQARDHAHELEVTRLKHELDKAMRQHEWEHEVGVDLGEELRDLAPRMLMPADPVAAGGLTLAFDKRLGRYVNDLPPRLFWYLTDYLTYTQELIGGWSRVRESSAAEEAGFPFMTGLLMLWLSGRRVVESWCSTGVVPDLAERQALWSDYVRYATAAGIRPPQPKPEEP
jgi:hypothetical protein